MASSGIRQKLLTFFAALAGMVVLPGVSFTLLNVGPAVRVVYYGYLPVEELAIALGSAVLGASLATDGVRRLRGIAPGTPWRRWQLLQWIGTGVLVAWIAFAQLLAFPASGDASERAAWARSRVPMYSALARVVASIPEVQRDVGRIVTVAPTAHDQHRAAREMNGDDMQFVLEVVGDRGRGTFYANCTLDDYAIYGWSASRWVFAGRDQSIARPSKP